MKPILHLLCALCVLCGYSVAAEKPNIIVILTDDHGWADLGVQSVDAHIRTPNEDQLARDGVRFSRGNVTAPQCTPSLAGLRSGRLDGVNLLPHLTGEKKDLPHETLYWRWADQAAIQEFPHKLILLGKNQTLLFDITSPETTDTIGFVILDAVQLVPVK